MNRLVSNARGNLPEEAMKMVSTPTRKKFTGTYTRDTSTLLRHLAMYFMALGVACGLLGGNVLASIHPCSATLISGNGQTASVNQTLSTLTIEIDGIGPGGGLVPVAGEPITWSITGSGGGSVSLSQRAANAVAFGATMCNYSFVWYTGDSG